MGPLSGVKVIEMQGIGPGPFAGMSGASPSTRSAPVPTAWSCG